jgi:hypothetical protein
MRVSVLLDDVRYTAPMLMVIFGAGASFDSSPTYPPGKVSPDLSGGDYSNNYHRPPLAKDLFEDRPIFRLALDAFPQCKSIVARLRDPAVTSGEKSIETVLRHLEDEALAYPRGQQELLAVRCYLQRAIYNSQKEWRTFTRRITNYLSLLREIERNNKGGNPVCLLTFNYDTLLEDGLQDLGFEIRQMNDYTVGQRAFRLFKIHGSINWGQVVMRAGADVRYPQVALSQMIDRFTELEITDTYHVCDPDSMGFYGGMPMFPAIAIPVEKKNEFVCPPTMLNQLVKLLPLVDKILSIGWRGTEEHFLQLLRTHLMQGVKLYTVAGTPMEAVNINRKMVETLSGKLSEADCQADPQPTGFTEFMRSLRVIPFLEG